MKLTTIKIIYHYVKQIKKLQWMNQCFNGCGISAEFSANKEFSVVIDNVLTLSGPMGIGVINTIDTIYTNEKFHTGNYKITIKKQKRYYAGFTKYKPKRIIIGLIRIYPINFKLTYEIRCKMYTILDWQIE